MKIGIIGSGMIGGTLGTHFTRAGHQVKFSSRNPEKLEKLVSQAGKNASIGTFEEAASFGELLLLAIPHAAVPVVSKRLGDIQNKIIIDATNYYPNRDGENPGKEAESNDFTQSQWTASYLNGAHVIKAFNTLYYLTLQKRAFSNLSKLTIPIAYNDEESAETVTHLIEEIGFDVVRFGILSESGPIEPDREFYGAELTKDLFLQKLEVFKSSN